MPGPGKQHLLGSTGFSLFLHRKCKNHYSEVEETLPRSFVWLLQLFSFLLDVTPAYLYEEVLAVERRVFGTKTPDGRT